MKHNRRAELTKYAEYAKYAPAHKGDVLKLPSPANGTAREGRCGGGKRRGCKSAAIIMSAGLALLSAFIPMNAQEAKAADTLYISGGGGGRGTDGVSGNGGPFAGSGITAYAGNPTGGGAYVGVGDPKEENRTLAGDKFIQTGLPNFPGNGSAEAKSGNNDGGGNASLEITGDLSSIYIINVQGGNGGNSDNSGQPPTPGGSATFNVTGKVTTDSLTVQSGADNISGNVREKGGAASAFIGTLQSTDGGNAVYTFTKFGGDLTVEITTLDATKGNVTLDATEAGADNVTITNLDLGGGNTFTLNGVSTSDLNIKVFNVTGQATFDGDLNAAGETMNFYLPGDVEANDTMLTMAAGSKANIEGAEVHAGVINSHGSMLLKPGDKVILIDASQAEGRLQGSPVNTTTEGEGMIGSLLLAKFIISTEDGELLVATLDGIGPAPESEMALIGNLASLAMVIQGGDLIAGPGMAAAVSAGLKEEEKYGLELFGVASTGKMRYDTNPHLDLTSTHLLTGVSRGWELAQRRLTLGAFFEYGTGSYESQGVYSRGPIRGDGSVRYAGGGILSRMDFAETGRGRFYAEASGRAGTVRNDFNSSGLSDFLGNDARFKSDSTYYSLHAGLGYLWNISERAMLDLYGKYFWTRVGGDSLYISTGEYLEFENFNSSRLRFGGRFSYAMNESVRYYAGAAWEYEFDGRARASANGVSLGSSSISGGTGIGELGLLITPSETKPLLIDLGIQGYTGKREGVTARLEISWAF